MELFHKNVIIVLDIFVLRLIPMQYNPNEIRPELASEDAFHRPLGPRKLERSQKVAVAILAFFAILVMGLWINQTKKSLNSSFETDVASEGDGTCTTGNCLGAKSAVDLRSKDTDKDGLNDYDELNVYGTSPYLEDSDSDGYSDKKEVESKNDPTCPFGQNCFVAPVQTEDKTNVNPDSLFNPAGVDMEMTPAPVANPGASPSASNPVVPATAAEANGFVNGATNPASLRSMLTEAGMDPQTLSQISDEELMATYQETVSEQ